MKDKEIIVAASGYFDPAHLGHIEYLKMAKELGDKLVVILNNDNWLLKKKSFLTDETIAYIMPKERSIDIDSPLDIIVAEALLKRGLI